MIDRGPDRRDSLPLIHRNPLQLSIDWSGSNSLVLTIEEKYIGNVQVGLHAGHHINVDLQRGLRFIAVKNDHSLSVTTPVMFKCCFAIVL